MNPFILLTFPRTGSTYIRIWLDSHTHIRSHGEVFLGHYSNEDGFAAHCSEFYGLGGMLHGLHFNRYVRKLRVGVLPGSYVEDFMERFYHDHQFPVPWVSYKEDSRTVGELDKQWAGFKLMYYQLMALPSLQKYIANNNFAVLHLVRRNLLKQYVSMLRMRMKKMSHSTSDVVKATPVQLNIPAMFRHFSRLQKHIGHFRSLYDGQEKYYEFTYESFFENPDVVGAGISETLGVPACSMEGAKLKKTSTNRLSDEIANSDEVITALVGTEYEGFLDDYER